MKNNNKGITMVSLVITIMVMAIIAGTTIYTSLNRFEINNLNKMYNDIKLLSDKVANYYVKYNGLPVVRDSSNNPVVYPVSSLNFDKNINDSGDYYIIDLKTMDGITLNYGADGINNPTVSSQDIYVVNEASHMIYYVKGVEAEGTIYHTLPNDENAITDNIPPAKPEIKVVSGTKDESGNYTSAVELEIVPGKDNWSGMNRTTYSINNGAETDITSLANNIYKITSDGNYTIKAKSYDKNGNVSQEESITIKISPKPKIGDKVAYDEGYSASKTNTVDSSFKMNNLDWRILDIEDDGIVRLISTKPTTSQLTLSGEQGWLEAETKLDTLCSELYANGTGVTARSLKIEDIDKLAGITTDLDRKLCTSSYGSKWRYKYNTTTKRIQYSTDNGVTWTTTGSNCTSFKEPGKTIIDSSNYLDEEGKLRIVELTNTIYKYKILDKINSQTADNILVSDLISKGLNNTNDAANNSYITQWMSSICVYAYDYDANFGVRCLRTGEFTYYSLCNNRNDSNSQACAVRPVVSLPADVFTTKTGGIWQLSM